MGDSLESLGVYRADTLQDFVPGLSISGDAPGSNTVSIRGIADLGGTFQSQSPVGYYLDETPISVLSTSMPEMMMWDLQRVEVLRGPQGTLFGDGSMAGTIRFITNKPDTEDFYGRVMVIGSTVDTGGNSYGGRALVNIPVSDTLALRVSAAYQDVAGWIDNPELNEKDTNDYDQLDGRIAVRWMPSDTFTLDFSYLHEEIDMRHRNTATSPGIFDPISLFPAGLERPQKQVNWETKDYDILNLTLDWDLGFASLVSATSQFEQNTASQTDWSPFSKAFFGPLISGGTAISNNIYTDISIVTQELRLVSNGDERLDWTAGVFYKLDERDDLGGWDFDLTDFDLSIFGGPYIGDFSESERNRGDAESESWSIFAELDYEITESLSLQVGARYYEDKRAFELVTVEPSLVFGDFSGAGEGDDSTVAPKLALTWQLNETVMAFAKVAKGFRPGGVNILAEGSNAIGFPMPFEFGAETLWSYEAGVKTQPTDWLMANMYIYHNDWTDIQLFNVTANGWDFIENAGEAKSDGVELELLAMPTDHLRINFNISYTDASIEKIDESIGASPILPGNKLPFVPKWSGGLVVDYSRPFSDNLLWRVVGNYSYRDKTFSGATNLPVEQTTSLSQLALRAGVETERWSLVAFANNLLNDADVTRAAQQVNGVPVVYKTYVQPRTLGVELQWSF